MLDDVPWLWAEGMPYLLCFLAGLDRWVWQFLPFLLRREHENDAVAYNLDQFSIMCNPNISQHSPLPKTSCSLVIIKLSIDVLDIRTCARAAAFLLQALFLVNCSLSHLQKKAVKLKESLQPWSRTTLIDSRWRWRWNNVKHYDHMCTYHNVVNIYMYTILNSRD